MSTTYTENTFATTYKDDYDRTKNYHKILFNSGKALQARELTQLQSVIQEQFSQLAGNLFTEGASISPGSFRVDNELEFIKISSATPFPSDPSVLEGLTFEIGSTGSNKEFLVVNAIAAEGDDPDTLIVEYTKDQVGGETGTRAQAGESLIGASAGTTYTFSVQSENTSTNSAVGLGSAISVDEGHFFIQGHVVYCPPQKLIFRKYETNQSSRFGFKVTQDIVNVDDDVSLYDNQGETPNLTSPGADRYRIQLTLADARVVLNEDDFIPIVEVVGGQIVSKTTTSSGFKSIRDEMAIRTYEESGDYVKRYFRASFEPNDDTTFKLKVSPGTAYVRGYRINKDASTTIISDKPTDTISRNNDTVTVDYANFLLYTDGKGSMPDFSTCEKIDIHDAANGGGNKIGTCRVRGINISGTVAGTKKLHIFDLQITDETKSIRDIQSVVTNSGAPTTNYLNIYRTNNSTKLYQSEKKGVIFDSPLPRPKTFSDHVYTVAKKKSFSLSGATTHSFSNSSSDTSLSNGSAWIVSSADSDEVSDAVVTFSGNDAEISGLVDGETYDLMYFEQLSAPVRKNKTLKTHTATYNIDSDGVGQELIELGKIDLYRVNSVREDSANGRNVLGVFGIDNGQRDTHYDEAKLLFRGGGLRDSSSVVPIHVSFDFFEHTAGDFFDVSSYSLPYVDIPVHRTANSRLVNLRDVVDLRPSINPSTGAFSVSDVLGLPQSNSVITCDGEYFMPRLDKLVLSKGGELRLIQGVSSMQPKYPSTPVDCIDLYKIHMNANTMHVKDLETTIIPRRGYTMEDINKIEKRIDKLEEATTLSLLESNAANERIFDDTGEERIHTGFFVDNFKNQRFTDTKSIEHRASMDPSKGLIRPSYKCKSIFLKYDSAESTDTVKKGDNIYLNHTETPYLSQTMASKTINVNPFHVEKTHGDLVLSPSKDTWKNLDHQAPLVIDAGTEFNTDAALLWNDWENSWGGIAPNDLQVGMTSDPLVQQTSKTTLEGENTSFVGQRVTTEPGDWVKTGSTSSSQVLHTGQVILGQEKNDVVGASKVVTKSKTVPYVHKRIAKPWSFLKTGHHNWGPKVGDEWVFTVPNGHTKRNGKFHFASCGRSRHHEHFDLFYQRTSNTSGESGNPYTTASWIRNPEPRVVYLNDGDKFLMRSVSKGKAHLNWYNHSKGKKGRANVYNGYAPRTSTARIKEYYTDVSTELTTYSKNVGIKETTTNTSLAKTDTITTENQHLTTQEYNTATETTTSVNRITAESVLTEIVDERVLQIIHIPWMRSRKVSFKATGLRPNTQYFPFFNDTDVSRFCKTKTFYKSSTIADPNYEDSDNARMIPEVELPPSTQHSEGFGDLISNSNGVLEGEFEVPNIVEPPMRFPTGTAIFELFDISVPDKKNALSYASQFYTASGVIESLSGEYTITNTRVLEVSGNATTKVDNDRYTTHTVSTDEVVTFDTQTDEKTEITKSTVYGPTETNSVTIGNRTEHVGTNVTYDYAQGTTGLAGHVYQNKKSSIPKYGTGDGKVVVQPKGAKYKDEDPTAQSFEVLDPNGIFLTRLRLFFESKPGTNDVQHGVSIAITEAPAGFPDRTRRVPGSLVHLDASDVKTISGNINIGDMLAQGTDFVFDEPIFLEGNGANYAIIIRSKSMEYKMYISEVQDFLLGSTTQRIHKQPTLGSLFVSQNTDVWEPRGQQDLAYMMYRADFENKGKVVLKNRKVRPTVLVANPIMTEIEGDVTTDSDGNLIADNTNIFDGNGKSYVTIFCEGHGLRAGDRTRIFGLNASASYNGIQGVQMSGLQTVVSADATSIKILTNGTATSSGRTGGGELRLMQHVPFELIRPDLDVLQPETTNYTFSAKMTRNTPLSGLDINDRFAIDDNFTLMRNKTNVTLDKDYAVFNSYEEDTEGSFAITDTNDRNKSMTTHVVMTTSDTRVSPVIDMESADLKLTHNIIDNTDENIEDEFELSTSSADEYRVTGGLDEEEVAGGTVASKHVCIPISLTETSRGLSVKMSVNRPPDTGIGLYYRTCPKDVNIKDISWEYAEPVTQMPSDTNKNTFREYQYLIGGETGELDPFDRFQLKITFGSTSSAKVPVVKSLRAIALAD
jgi:hypothetical protein